MGFRHCTLLILFAVMVDSFAIASEKVDDGDISRSRGGSKKLKWFFGKHYEPGMEIHFEHMKYLGRSSYKNREHRSDSRPPFVAVIKKKEPLRKVIAIDIEKDPLRVPLLDKS